MKKIFLFSFLLLKLATVNSQCNFQWGPMQTAYETQWGNVYIQVQFSNCVDGGVCGWPIVALEHNFGEKLNSLSVKLRGLQCDDKPIDASFSGSDIQPNAWLKDRGNWHIFKKVTEILAVDINFNIGSDVYRIEYDKEKNIRRVYKNNNITASNNNAEIYHEAAPSTSNTNPVLQNNNRNAGNNSTSSSPVNINSNNQIQKKQETSTSSNQQIDYKELKRQADLKAKRYNDSIAQLRKKENNAQSASADALSATTAGVTSLMLGNGDNTKSLRKTSFKASAFLGYFQIPAISNSTNNSSLSYSNYDNISSIGGGAGLHFWFDPVKFISLRLSPAILYGLEVTQGASGATLEYSGDSKLMLGKKLKVFGEGSYISRSGTYSLDIDAASASTGFETSTGVVTTSSFGYNTIRYGGGIYLETSTEDDSYLELAILKDNTTIKSATNKPLLYKATLVFGKLFISGTYSPNYPLDGKAVYGVQNGDQKKAYVNAQMGVIISL